jgi:very-short-patch-repair endonuclease
MLSYNKSPKEYSGQLRRNITDAENLLSTRIRNKQLKGYQFYRQKIIDNYIVDFYCSRANLIIEVDGGHHYEDKTKEKDKARDDYLKNVGLRVLRFSDREVFENLNGVMEKIWENL